MQKLCAWSPKVLCTIFENFDHNSTVRQCNATKRNIQLTTRKSKTATTVCAKTLQWQISQVQTPNKHVYYYSTYNYHRAPMETIPFLCQHHSNLCKHFFSELVIAPWNSLNITIKTVHYVAAFKSSVCKSNLSAYLHNS